jgi:hypothetical protein
VAVDIVSMLTGGPLSELLSNLQYGTNGSVPTALISAETNSGNLSGVGTNLFSSFIVGYEVLASCVVPAGSLLTHLSPVGWNSVFAYQSGSPNVFDDPSTGYQYNDAIVPLSSQLADVPPATGPPAAVVGLLHSSSLTYLGFSGIGELDSTAFTVPLVVQYLNAQYSTLAFYLNLP